MVRQQVTQWLERDSSVAQAFSMTQEFLKAIHRHKPARLQQWLAEAEQGAIPKFHSVARGLRRDEAAVMEALQWPYSNGPTEAAVNSLKTVKRQMLGRGKLDLLRKRYLALAERRHWYKRTQQPSSELVQVLSEVP
ncbi:transposase [Alicyclobacillaceae bacterium I2511]|jgi:transposase|nr:transposase [Alicyclobacillaceae bacterium I2511]